MSRLVSIAVGGRPVISELCIRANLIQDPTLKDDLTLVRWRGDRLPLMVRQLERPGATRAEAHNLAIADRLTVDDLPDWWLILDDDVVLGQFVFERMQRVMEADPQIAILGAWNDGCERGPLGQWRGTSATVGGEVVQYGGGREFNVGGAVQLWRRSTIERFGGYDESKPWLEDHDITQRVMMAGLDAAIARTIPAAIIQDAWMYPEHRAEQRAKFDEAVRRMG